MARETTYPASCGNRLPMVISLERAAGERLVGWGASVLLSHRFTGDWIRTGIVALLFGAVVLPLVFLR